MNKVFVDRSRIEQFQRCPRSRFLEYHQGGVGIQGANKPLPLAVGGAVHEGLAHLLRTATLAKEGGVESSEVNWREIEDQAVSVALEDFRSFSGHLEVDLSERSAMEKVSEAQKEFHQQLAGSVGMTPEQAGLPEAMEQASQARNQFDKYLFEEQSALVEGMVRAYARRRLRPLLEQFEVLEVEREGQWLLSKWKGKCELRNGRCIHCDSTLREIEVTGDNCPVNPDSELWFMSRPDALLLEKESKQLYILSFKTATGWDIRKARDAERDMQGLSEGIEVEERMAGQWRDIHESNDAYDEAPKDRTTEFLKSCSAPPRILGIRYEYLLKGDRKLDDDLTRDLGIETRSQRSHLIRGYLNPGMTSGDEQWNWSWDYYKEDGSTSKLYWKSWRGTPVWKHMTVKQWIDMLDQSTETFAEEGRTLGWSSRAQATGFTGEHPLDAVFIPPIVVFRNEDDLRDLVEQMEASEIRIAEAVLRVASAKDEGERRSLLNQFFPQSRKNCSFPSECQFVKICYGGDEIRRDPLSSGAYQGREPNHPQERDVEGYTRSS